MCYKAVEGSGSRTIQFLKIGIFILLIPTLFVFASITLMAYRRRKGAFGEGNQEDLSGDSLPELPLPPSPTSH